MTHASDICACMLPCFVFSCFSESSPNFKSERARVLGQPARLWLVRIVHDASVITPAACVAPAPPSAPIAPTCETASNTSPTLCAPNGTARGRSK